jgi:hypothetical protein
MKNSMRKILDAVIYALTGIHLEDNEIPGTAHVTIWFLAWTLGGFAVLMESEYGIGSLWTQLLTAVPIVFISGRIMGAISQKIYSKE